MTKTNMNENYKQIDIDNHIINNDGQKVVAVAIETETLEQHLVCFDSDSNNTWVLVQCNSAEEYKNLLDSKLLLKDIYMNKETKCNYRRHFKKKWYAILGTAKDNTTQEEYIIYLALYDDYKIYARKKSMFLSPTDKAKYPDVKQINRFESIESLESQFGINIAFKFFTQEIDHKEINSIVKPLKIYTGN